MSDTLGYKLERQVDDYIEHELEEEIGLTKKDYGIESYMDEYLKEALKGGAKTLNKTNFGEPDFNITKYDVPVLFENKLYSKYLIKLDAKGRISTTQSAIKKYAVNGALHYARTILKSKMYKSCIIVGVAGDNPDHVVQQVYYVYAVNGKPKRMYEYDNLHFLSTKEAFQDFLNNALLTETEKHQVLVKSQQKLQKKAKLLNKLMNNLNISTEQRVVYVSGMLLAMQKVTDAKTGQYIAGGLTPCDLQGIQSEKQSDSIKIIDQLSDFLNKRGNITQDKQKLMMDSFEGAIHSDLDRDKLIDKDKIVGKMIQTEKASITKQVFTFLYKEIFLQIDADSGSLDIMGSMYSEFLKYALGDGGSLGKVLTPPYITNLMAKAIDVGMNDRVMDLATGSGAFLVSSMKLMIDDANNTYGSNSEKANRKIQQIKKSQLLGVEYDAKMYTLAASNMILRGDGSSQIKKGDTFKEPTKLYTEFNANKLLLNPPFSADNYGMPFLAYGLKFMSNKERAKAAIIIQDSAGSGKSRTTNQEILKNNTLLASIKMPSDLFVPNAIVSTSIYIFEVGVPHDLDRGVKFIDFRNDGYKRTKRGIKTISSPANRYHDLLLLLKSGQAAVNNSKFHNELWDLKKQYVEDVIDNTGTDWNFENHYKVNTTPEEEDWDKAIRNYMKFKLGKILD